MANFNKNQKSLPFLSLRILNYHEKFVYKLITLSKIILFVAVLILSVEEYPHSILCKIFGGPSRDQLRSTIRTRDNNILSISERELSGTNNIFITKTCLTKFDLLNLKLLKGLIL